MKRFGPYTREEMRRPHYLATKSAFMRRPVRKLRCPMCSEPLTFVSRYIDWDRYKCSNCPGAFRHNAHWKTIRRIHTRISRQWRGSWVMCTCGKLASNGGTGWNGAGVRWVEAANDHAWHEHVGIPDKDCCACHTRTP